MLGQTEEICYACRPETPQYLKYFPVKASTPTKNVDVEKWLADKNVALAAFKLLPANSSMSPNDLFKAFIQANTRFQGNQKPKTPSQEVVQDVKSSRVCDGNTCTALVLKNQKDFDLPSAKRC
jgi:hypothetical protein